MKPGISSTHIRPSASKSMAIGSTTSGSLATSSRRYPGGRTIVFSSSSADRTGAFSGVLRTGGGQAAFWALKVLKERRSAPTTNPKLQDPNPNARPNPNAQTGSHWPALWALGVRWSLELGAWDLILVIS